MIDNYASEPPPSERVKDIARIERALREAVRDALRRHKLAGNPVAVWRDGRVVWVQAKDIPVSVGGTGGIEDVLEHTPIERRVFDTQILMHAHPPIWRDRNKRAVYEVACPPGCPHGGQLTYTRWRAMSLPEQFLRSDASHRLEQRENLYDYTPALNATGAVEWHVNFADPHLFVAYGSGLFAQDEMQVAEHPALGALFEALKSSASPALTVDDGRPTPILVTGAERRCSIATVADPEQGRPHGLYGNAFAAAPVDAVRRATRRIDPPTVTNLIAIAAPSGGYGRYRAGQIAYVLTTAYTGFRAAVLETGGAQTVIHTGFWGCGAFGGNRVLMALLQVIAAGMAGVDRLVFHTHNAAGSATLDSALGRIAHALPEPTIESRCLVDRIAAMGFEWGVSDGN